eukprot:10597827-Alexandrium_andersonii.AAC.1
MVAVAAVARSSTRMGPLVFREREQHWTGVGTREPMPSWERHRCCQAAAGRPRLPLLQAPPRPLSVSPALGLEE